MAELVDRWPRAVGPEIARFAWPSRIARDGTIHVATADSVWAFELGHRAAEIAARLGGDCRLRFAPGPLPEPPSEAGPEPVVPSDEEAREAARLTGSMTHRKLRESVQKALSFALARRRSGHPF
jgi:hypothetical protein